jgi:hypothetical protein
MIVCESLAANIAPTFDAVVADIVALRAKAPIATVAWCAQTTNAVAEALGTRLNS